MTNSIKAALWTALFSFVTLAASAVTGFLSAVLDWLGGTNESLDDDLSVFTKLLGVAAVSAMIGLVNWIVRALQSRNVLPGNGPQYGTPSQPTE